MEGGRREGGREGGKRKENIREDREEGGRQDMLAWCGGRLWRLGVVLVSTGPRVQTDRGEGGR